MDDAELHIVYNGEKITERQTNEVIGFARGILADGEINEAEIRSLHRFIAASIGVVGNPLLAEIQRKIDHALGGGHLNEAKVGQLKTALTDLTGDDYELGEELKSATLPLCKPEPTVVHANNRFCFTGPFQFGSRKDCHSLVEDRGGVAGSLTKKTDFLVIGTYVSESWKHTNFGTKIIKGMNMRNNGVPLCIISERTWTKYH